MITDLRLQNYRSYSDESFELSQGVNIIVGPNASGKTNLLESLLVASIGSSYRARDTELVRNKKPWARIDIDMSDGSHRTVKIELEPESSKTYELNTKTYKRLTLQHSVPAVLFEPNHLLMLTGGPEGRRNYLDDLLEKTVSGYGSLRRQYKRTLAQRNRLLKNGHVNENEIFPWNVKLSQLGGQIIKFRQQLVEEISKQITPLYKKLSGAKTKVKVEYGATWPAESYESSFLKKLDTSLATDRERGFTSSGPHREDLLVFFDGRPAQEVASRGETRTAVLALKIIELSIIHKARDLQPILLLDDVFSELDGRRRHALTDYLAQYQTFITTTDADLVIKHFTTKSHIIPLG